MSKPTITVTGNIRPNEKITLKVNNPAAKEGVLLIEIDGKSTVIKTPPTPSYEVTQTIPNLPGKIFICNFYTAVDGVTVFSNTLPLQIPEPDSGTLSIAMTARPMKAVDDAAGWKQNGVVTLTIFLSEKDDVRIGSNGTCNLKAELVSSNSKILAQQFNVLSVYNRTDSSKWRAKVVHGYVVLDSINGHLGETYQFLVKTCSGFSGSESQLATKNGDIITVDTGAAKFILNAGTKGFNFKRIQVGKQDILNNNDGYVYMHRRHFDGSPGQDYLTSIKGVAKAEIVKSGQAYTEIVVTGTLLPDNPIQWQFPQKYYLLLKFHVGSSEMEGELMLVNTNTLLEGIPANYTIPYDGFGLKFTFMKDRDNLINTEVLFSNGETITFSSEKGQVHPLCGYKNKRWQSEYEGLWDGHYWPENQRVPGSSGGDLNFITKGFAVYQDGALDGSHKDQYNDIDKYPKGCTSHIQFDNWDFACQVGVYPEYEQPIGMTINDLGNLFVLDLRLTDKLALNELGKSIPYRTTIRKSFFLDFDYNVNQGLQNVPTTIQAPYVGIYDVLTDYNNRTFDFEWLTVTERSDVWKKLGFLKDGDNYQYGDLGRNKIWKPFFIGSNRTGGDMNWDQAYLQFCFGLHGLMGWLMELRLQLTFHSVLGRRQYEDTNLGQGVLNPNQPASNLWAIDIEHEDHKGYHAGVLFFGNPLDVIAMSRMAYETLNENVGHTLWIRAIGNQIGRNIEEQSTLRALLTPQRNDGHSDIIENEILPNMLKYIEDFFSRRLDPNDPVNSAGWLTEPGPLPPFIADPEDSDWPVSDLGIPFRYMTVKKSAGIKMIDEFHLTKGLASFREFMLTINDFPIDYQARVTNILSIGALRQVQRAMTFAQFYTFLFPYCTNFVSQCVNYTHLTPWERIKLQKKYYPCNMTICDDRTPDQENLWGGYDYMDAYADAAKAYLVNGDKESAFYILRAALNHMSMNRWDKFPSHPCDQPPDNKQNDFWWSSQYPSYLRLFKIIKDNFLDKFAHSYPLLFPTEIKYEVA